MNVCVCGNDLVRAFGKLVQKFDKYARLLR